MDFLLILTISVLTPLLYYSWHLISLLSTFFNYRIKIISGSKTIKDVQDGVSRASLYDRDQPLGLMIGKVNGYRFIAYSSCDKNGDTLYMFSHKNSVDDIDFDKAHKLKTYTLGGNKFNPYTSGEEFLSMTPKGWQKEVCDDIIAHYKKSKYCSALITGSSGSGKSSIAYILASILEGKVLNYDPTIYQLSSVLKKIKYSEDHPLVILIDEIDEFLINFSCDRNNKFMIPEWHNKRSYNNFFDYYEKIINPNLIIICTANTPYEEIEDQSLVRSGRYKVRRSC